MKNSMLFLFMALLTFSCSDDPMGPESVSAVSGTLSCVNDNPIAGVTITITGETGNSTFTSTTNTAGEYDFSTVPNGKYLFSFSGESFHAYSSADYTAIVSDLSDIVLALDTGTNVDEIAYHMRNANDGLTTLDKFYFQQLESGQEDLSDVAMPWRYITKTDLDLGESKISDKIVVDFDSTTPLDIVGIYYGDSSGTTCN